MKVKGLLITLTFAMVASTLSTTAKAQEEEEPELFPSILKLSYETWEEVVENDTDNAWLVTFYLPWCEHA